MTFTELASAPSHPPEPFTDRLRLAVAAYLARFKATSREQTESDLRCYLTWCTERGLEPLAARRPHLELYIRWMQEIRRFQPSTVSRRLSVATGFYRTCVLDGILEHSPAEHVRRPAVPAESPTLGFTHLQFEALLTAARQSPNPYDFALVAMLGLLGLRIFEATSAFVTTMLDADVDLRDVRSPPATPTRAPPCGMTEPARTWTATPTTSWPPTWLPAPDPAYVSRGRSRGRRPTLPVSECALCGLAWHRGTPHLLWSRQEVSP